MGSGDLTVLGAVLPHLMKLFLGCVGRDGVVGGGGVIGRTMEIWWRRGKRVAAE